MFNIGPLELMVLLVLALIVFGPAKLPELMASAGNAIREFQRASRELTSVFDETRSEFTSVMNIDDLMQSVEPDATTNNATPAYEPVYPTAEVEVQSAAAPVNSAPSEYETAAGMIDPFEPFEAPETETPSIVAIPQAGPEEFATSAGLVEPPIPFESETETVAATSSTEIFRTSEETSNGLANGHVDNIDLATAVESPVDVDAKSKPVAVGRSVEMV